MRKIFFDERVYNNIYDESLLNCGLAKKEIRGLSFDRFYTEQEMQANREYNASIAGDFRLWAQHCDKIKKAVAEALYLIIEMLNSKFSIGQYRNDGGKKLSDWEMWFWCNSDGINGVTGTHEINGRKCDLSHFTLSFENKEIVPYVLAALEQYEYSDYMHGVKCTVIYEINEEKETVSRICRAFAEAEITSPFHSNKGRFYACGNEEMRLYKRNNGGYAFKRKHERSYYLLDNDRILKILIDNGLLEKYLSEA